MLYMIYGEDVPGSLEKRLATLKANHDEVHEACNGYDVFEIDNPEEE